MLFDALARIVCCLSFSLSLLSEIKNDGEKWESSAQQSTIDCMADIWNDEFNTALRTEPIGWTIKLKKKHTHIQHLIVIEGNLSHSLTNSNMGKRDELLVNLWPVNTWNKMFDGMSWFPPKKNSNKIHRTHEKFYFLAAKLAASTVRQPKSIFEWRHFCLFDFCPSVDSLWLNSTCTSFHCRLKNSLTKILPAAT